MAEEERKRRGSYSERRKSKLRGMLLRGFSRVPKRVFKVGGLVLIVVGGIVAWQILKPPPTDEEQLLDLAEDALEAELERDYEDIWDLLSPHRRKMISETLRWFRGLDENDPEDAKSLANLKRECGLSPGDLEDMDPEDWFVAAREGEHEHRTWPPEELMRTMWSGLEIGKVKFWKSGKSAEVDLGGTTHAGKEYSRYLFFQKSDGEWGYVDIAFMSAMKFRTLDQKFAAYLPREAVAPGDVEVVIEVGPATAGEDLAQLQEWLAKTFAERGGRFTVLIDAAPQASVQRVVCVIDAVRTNQHFDVLLTRRAEGDGMPGPGIRINGVPLPEAVDGASYTNPADHPATLRILTLEK